MKIISGFKSINKKKTYFSPDFYWNCGSSFGTVDHPFNFGLEKKLF